MSSLGSLSALRKDDITHGMEPEEVEEYFRHRRHLGLLEKWPPVDDWDPAPSTGLQLSRMAHGMLADVRAYEETRERRNFNILWTINHIRKEGDELNARLARE